MSIRTQHSIIKPAKTLSTWLLSLGLPERHSGDRAESVPEPAKQKSRYDMIFTILIREDSHLNQALLKTSQATKSWNFKKISTPARDMAAKRSKIQKLGRGVTFWTAVH